MLNFEYFFEKFNFNYTFTSHFYRKLRKQSINKNKLKPKRMKKLILFIAVILLAAVTVNAQQTLPANNFTKQTVTLSKTSDGTQTTTVQRHCGTMEHLTWMEQQDPTLEAKMQAEEKKFNDYIAEHQQELENSKTTYTLPTVVHVVYNGTSGYVTPARVNEQINQTNSDWAGTNGRSMESFATTLRVDCGITLCLATKDPSGNTTTGIDYKTTTKTSFTTNDGVKSTSTGGAAAWDPTKYMNIWVCNLGGGLCGYAQFPSSGINSTYGVVIHYQFFGLTGASSPYNLGGTVSHEFGHCFNLYHTWGDDSGSCSGTDNCADTPNQADATYGNHSGTLTDACSTTAPGIMYMNFMDYSDDADYTNMTPNQKTRMQSAVSTYLTSVANNAATACGSVTPQAPVADFSASATTVPTGTVVAFTDLSSNTPTGWTWSITPGTGWSWSVGNASTQNPSVLFSTIGTYTVSLTATNLQGSDAETKTSYITVTDGSVQTCDTLHYPMPGTPVLYSDQGGGYVAGNNSYGDLIKAEYFATYAPYTEIEAVYLWFGKVTDGGSTTNITINVYNNGGTSGAPGTVIGTATVPMSTLLTNFNASAMTGVAFASPITITGPFYIGVVLPQSPGDTLAFVSNTDGDTSPGTAWEQFSDGTSWYAMSVSGTSWGINVSLGIFPIVCTATVSTPENSNLENVVIYPNPANDVLNINMINYGKGNVKVDIYNAMGELVKSINSTSQMLQVDMTDQSSGVYYVTLVSDKGTVTRQVSIIK
jgi:PKD repeat protein